MNGGFDFGTAITLLRLGHRLRWRGDVYAYEDGTLAILDGPARRVWLPSQAALLADDWRLA